MFLATQSLRNKIFLTALGPLLLLAGIIMPVTQSELSDAIETSERHAVDNVVNLALQDANARWSALLDAKINSVRTERGRLLELGATAQSALESHAQLAKDGVIDVEQARQAARVWVDTLKLGVGRNVFIYDANFRVLASSDSSTLGADISNVLDLKGRRVAEAMRNETMVTGRGFALYNWPNNPSPALGPTAEKRRYAYFQYFHDWDWVVAVSDNAQVVLDQVEHERESMEQAVRTTLSSLTLARTGFMLVATDDGRMVVPPPQRYARLLSAADNASGAPLYDLLQDRRAGTRMINISDGGSQWLIQTVRYKPLGWTLAAAVPASDYAAPAKPLLIRQALIVCCAFIISLALAWLVATSVANPLDRLTQYARSLAREDLTNAAPPPGRLVELAERRHDEVGRLAASFIFLQRQLIANVARLLSETASRERFENELNIARDIQVGLLPMPLQHSSAEYVELKALMLPAKEVGGDLYDYFELPNGSLCFAIGDVSGKGVPAALFMAVTRTLIRAAAEDESDPAAIVQRVNNRLSKSNPNMMFVTLLVCVLNLQTGKLAWANAGHPPPAIVVGREGVTRLLTGRSGPACGVIEDANYISLYTHVFPGEIVFGYTDGVTDAVDPQGYQFGDARLMELLTRPTTSAALLTQTILGDIHRFCDGAEPFDDITLIAVLRL